MSVILVAEDDAEINSLLALTLRLEGHDVLQVREGSQVVETAERHGPDLVLLDVMLPRLSGYEAARAMQNKPATAHIPIIFVTARDEVEDMVQGLEMAVDYVCKPFAMPELLARVRAALRTRKLQDELRASNEQLARLALTDPLTNLCNRRGFNDQLEEELWRAKRFGHHLAVVLFDLDHFKEINDTYGHPAGDRVLQAFSDVLLHSSRRIDTIARLGGEEFAAILPATDEAGATIFAHKVRTATQALEIPATVPGEIAHATPNGGVPPTGSIHLTVSGGGAVARLDNQHSGPPAGLAHVLVEAADRYLYDAKQAGRNRVAVHTMDSQKLAAIEAMPAEARAEAHVEAAPAPVDTGFPRPTQ